MEMSILFTWCRYFARHGLLQEGKSGIEPLFTLLQSVG